MLVGKHYLPLLLYSVREESISAVAYPCRAESGNRFHCIDGVRQISFDVNHSQSEEGRTSRRMCYTACNVYAKLGTG